MPIDLYSSIKKASQWAFGSPLLNGVLGNSLFVSATIAFLMILIVMFMYPAKAGTPFSVVGKMFIYMLFGSLLIVFLHDGVLKHAMEEEESTKEAEDFMRNTTMKGREADPSYSSLYKPVEPTPAIQAQKISSIQPTITPVQNAPPEPPQILTSDTITGGATLNATKRIKGDTNTFKLH